MNKLATILLLAIAAIATASCNNSNNEPQERTVTATEAIVTHVLDGNDNKATASLGQATVKINRTAMTTSLTTEATIGGSTQSISLDGLATTLNSEKGIFTFTAESAKSGSVTITNLTGTYNYYLDVVTLSYTVDSRYRVNAMNNAITFQYGTTEAKCDTATFKQSGAIYTFDLKQGLAKADLKMAEMRINKSLGMIDNMDYDNVDVAITANGFEITATDCPTVTDFKNPQDYLLKSAKYEINMAAATLSGTFSIPGYTLTTSGTLYKSTATDDSK